MTEIETIKQYLKENAVYPYGTKTIDELEEEGDKNSLAWLSSLITTIESQQEKLDLQTEPVSEIIEFLTEGIAQKDALIESQKEEIERLQKPALTLAYRVLKQKYEQDGESYVEHILNNPAR